MPESALPPDREEEASGRILAVDPGRVRWGFALSDPARKIVARFWSESLTPRTAPRRILDLVGEHKVGLVLLGLAVRGNQSEGEMASTARSVAGFLASKGVPTAFWDESLTSRLAEATQAELSARRTRRKPRQPEGKIARRSLPSAQRRKRDGISAAVLLEYYLAHCAALRNRD